MKNITQALIKFHETGAAAKRVRKTHSLNQTTPLSMRSLTLYEPKLASSVLHLHS